MRTGRPVLLKVKIGNQYGDLICINKEKRNGNYYYLMECTKCHRTKWMKSSTIRIQHGITHRARTYHLDDGTVNDAVNNKIKTYKNIKFKRLP